VNSNGINGDGKIIEDFGSGLRTRQSQNLFCSAETCGTVDAIDCVQAVKNVATNGQTCTDEDIIFAPFAGDCVVIISGHDKQPLCTPSSQVAALAHNVFNACVNDTAIRSGGCFELEHGVRVCVRNRKSTGCF